MSLAPLLLAVANDLSVFGVGANLHPMVFGSPTLLAFPIATNALLWTVDGGLKDLLTVTATTTRQHARLFDLSSEFVGIKNSEQNKTAALRNIETFIEFLPRPRRWGLGLVSRLRRQPAKSAPFFTGPNTLSLDAKLVAAALALQRVAGGRGDGLDTLELRDHTGLKRSAVARALEELAVGGYVHAYLGRFRMH
jgi:hypothetical protein